MSPAMPHLYAGKTPALSATSSSRLGIKGTNGTWQADDERRHLHNVSPREDHPGAQPGHVQPQAPTTAWPYLQLPLMRVN
jgi:hypothetical protein